MATLLLLTACSQPEVSEVISPTEEGFDEAQTVVSALPYEARGVGLERPCSDDVTGRHCYPGLSGQVTFEASSTLEEMIGAFEANLTTGKYAEQYEVTCEEQDGTGMLRMTDEYGVMTPYTLLYRCDVFFEGRPLGDVAWWQDLHPVPYGQETKYFIMANL